MLVIIDYGLGNCGSVLNMINRIGYDAKISANPNDIAAATKLILPGVGSFDAGMENIKSSNLFKELENAVVKKEIPILGICLGMQLFFSSSEEGSLAGLGWIDGQVKKFNLNSAKFKVPHMGWNSASIQKDTKLFSSLEDENRFYFVHSYYAECSNEIDIAAKCNYGHDFVCAVQKNNIMGVQFHPEKSHKYGMNLLLNYIKEPNV